MTDNLYQQEAEFALAVTFGHTEGSLMLDWAVVSDYTVMMMLAEAKTGEMIEYNETNTIFTRPSDKRTEDYVTGRFG